MTAAIEPADAPLPGSDRALRILVVTGGHRVDLDAFLAMVARICSARGWLWAHAVRPGAQDWLRPEYAGAWDAVLCHDIPGLALRRGQPPRPTGPAPQVAIDLAGLLHIGQGLLVTHHALAGWPGWPGWADVIGGRFLYAPGQIHGRAWPSSGYRMDRYRVCVDAPGHPICAGITDFDVEDELYSCPVFTDDVVPLLRTDADLRPSRFISTYEQVVSGAEGALGATYPPASDLLGWVTSAGRSPVAYLLPGDNAATFGHPMYQQLIENALAWVSSPEAGAWAHTRASTVDVSVPSAGAVAGSAAAVSVH